MKNDKRTPALDDDSLKAVSGGIDTSEITECPKITDRTGRRGKLDNGSDEPAQGWTPTENENVADPQSPSLNPAGTYELNGVAWKP